MSKINSNEKEVLKRALRLVKFQCPSDYGLDGCDGCDRSDRSDCTCIECWIDAVSIEDEIPQSGGRCYVNGGTGGTGGSFGA